MKNAINFFEIPASNFKRATRFYENLLDTKLLPDQLQGIKMAFFPSDENTVGGAICHGKGYTPNNKGVLLYLNSGNDIASTLSKVEASGGKVVVPQTLISGEIGNFALITDTEGNKVGIFSKK